MHQRRSYADIEFNFVTEWCDSKSEKLVFPAYTFFFFKKNIWMGSNNSRLVLIVNKVCIHPVPLLSARCDTRSIFKLSKAGFEIRVFLLLVIYSNIQAYTQFTAMGKCCLEDRLPGTSHERNCLSCPNMTQGQWHMTKN